MSVAIVDNSQDRGVQNDISQGGYRPQLYLVSAGAYGSNAVYGSGAASIGTYDDQVPPVTLRNNSSSQCQTRSVVRQQDKDCDFNVSICLDASQPDPFGGTDELRIRVLQPLALGEAARYLNGLPNSDPLYSLPLFDDVEVLNQVGLNLLPDAVNSVLQARLLKGGDLALVQKDNAAGPPPVTAALTGAQLGALLGGGAGDLVRIIIRGTFRQTSSS